jgi:hypothetical protein
MSGERTDQPSKVSTEEEVRPADEHVVTSDLPENVVTTSDGDQNAKPAESPPGDQKPAAPAAADPKQQPRRDRSAERRISRLTKQIGTLSDGRAEDRQQIETLKGQVSDLTAATAAASPEPQLVDFANPQEYAKAYGKWSASSEPKPGADPKPATAPAKARDPNAHAANENPDHRAEPAPEIKAFQTLGQAKYGDEFLEALEIEGTAVDVDMGEFLMDSEFGPEIYIHLANNQEEAKKIYDSGAVRKVAALNELATKAKAGELDVIGEGQLEIAPAPEPGPSDTKPAQAPAAKAKPAPGSRETAAKAPPEDTGQPGSATVLVDPDNESMDDYAARRAREVAKRAGHLS